MLFLLKIEDPYGDNIEMIIAAKDKGTAVKLFKKKLGYSKTNNFGEHFCKSMLKEYKSEYKDVLKRTKNCSDETKEYYLNKECYCIGDFKFSLIDTTKETFYEKLLKSYKDYYYRENYSLEYHLNHDIFEVINLNELDSGNSILNFTSIYHGR